MRGSADSGAGSYSQRSPKMSCGMFALPAPERGTGLVDVMSVALRRFRVVVRRLIRARLFLVDLPHEVVQERARAEPVARRIEPCIAECLLYGDEIMQRLLRGANA